jgi:hypothetical protein
MRINYPSENWDLQKAKENLLDIALSQNKLKIGVDYGKCRAK